MILQGDVLDKLAELPDKSVHCCVIPIDSNMKVVI